MNILRCVAVATLLTITGSLPTAAIADPPPWAPAHGWRAQHQYVYYPDANIYRSRDSGVWFWLAGDGWQTGVQLPDTLRAYVRTGGITIGLDVDRPYLRDRYVRQHYGHRAHK